LTIPLATRFITPESYQGDVGKNHLTYAGFHDLAYLHPNVFAPDPSVLQLLCLREGEKYIIMRFVAWEAAHDIGKKGLSSESRRRIIHLLSRHAKVFITSERSLEEEFEPYRLSIPPEKLLDALAFATMYIGEGGSMATEAAILGTPSVFVSPFTAGVLQELENKYDLMYSFQPYQEATIVEKINQLMGLENLKGLWQEKRQRLLDEKIDLTRWMVDVILQYARKRVWQ
jgi:predicted glycosyltransferase